MGVAFAGSCDRKFSWRSRGNFALSYVLTVSFNDDAQFYVRFSNRPVWVKRFEAILPLQCRCRLRARASLRTRRKGPSSMGFENEGEQSLGRPYRQMRQVQADMRSHLIHRPARDIIPPRGGARVSPIDCDLVLSCCCSFLPAPAKLGAVNPDPVHDHGQSARQRHDRLFPAAAPGDLHRPGLEPRPFDGAGQ